MSSAQRPPSSGAAGRTEPDAQTALRLFRQSALGRFPRLRGRPDRNDELRRKLSQAIEEHASRATERALSGHAAGEDAGRLDELQKLLAALPARSNRLAPLAVASVCVIAASIMLTDAPTTLVQFSVTSKAVQVRVADPLVWPGDWRIGNPRPASAGSPPPGVFLSDVAELDLPPEWNDGKILAGRAGLKTTGGIVTLKGLDLDPGVDLTIVKDAGNFVDVRLRNRPAQSKKNGAGFRGQLSVSADATLVAAGADPPTLRWQQKPYPLVFSFSDDGAPAGDEVHQVQAVPLQLRTFPVESLTLPRMEIDELSLAPDETTNVAGTPSFTSAIVRGSMVLPETGEIIDLKGADLKLHDAHGFVSGLEIRPDGVDFTFEGDAKTISLGPPRYARTHGPNRLQALYYDDKIKLFWAAIVLLWGVLWGARTLLSST